MSAIPHRSAPRAWWLLLPLALVELLGSIVVRARVPDDADLRAAAAHVAAELGPEDAVVAAPRWLDPSLRAALGAALGDRFDAALAAPDGLEGRVHLFVVSVRGHEAYAESNDVAAVRARSAIAGGTLEDLRFFGRVRVQRFRLAGLRTRYDFLAHLDEAVVTQASRPCPRTTSRGSGRGLGEGPVLGPERFACGGGDELRVAATVIEDLTFGPRYCIAQRPASPPITVTFPRVALGSALALHAGVHWVTERQRDGTAITLRVRAAEVLLGELVHRDGDGWASFDLPVPAPLRDQTGDLSFEVEGPPGRSFCWSGRTLGGAE